MNAIQKRIREAFWACKHLCESSRDADAWFRRSFEAAQRGEREHRAMGARFTRGAARYKLPVADAARCFAVKWFLSAHERAPTSFADACAAREDCLYGYGARDRVCETNEAGWLVLGHEYADVVELDYCKAFAA